MFFEDPHEWLSHRRQQKNMADRVRLCGRGGQRGDRRSFPQQLPAFRGRQSRRCRGGGGHLWPVNPGEKITVEWRAKPVWIVKRTPAQLAELPKLDDQLADPQSRRKPDELTPAYARNEAR